MKTILCTTPLFAVLAGLNLNAQAAVSTVSPDNVGDVTLYGTISAANPMWKWTVNNYPGVRLDAKPSTADTSVSGKVTYPLRGQWFIAASGYLPSFVPIRIGTANTSLGTRDITTLSSPDGTVKVNVTGTIATISIPATRSSASGTPETGTLILNADEIRGQVFKEMDGGIDHAWAIVEKGATAVSTAGNDSCWVGNTANGVFKHSLTGKTLPVFTATGTDSSSGAIAAFNTALVEADKNGSVRYTNVAPTAEAISTVSLSKSCAEPTAGNTTTSISTDKVFKYQTAAHVLALKPVSVSFPTAATGAWNATLTVTAYQM